jgi:hypothetical protein
MTAAARCAQCGRGLPAPSSSAPRLVLLCKRCRSAERPTAEEIAAPEAQPLAPARGLVGRWRRLRARPRMMLRLLLFALALCIALIRLLER